MILFILKLIFFHLDLETNSVPAYCNEPEEVWSELWAASSWPGGLSADAVPLLPMTLHNSHTSLLFFILLFIERLIESQAKCHILSGGVIGECVQTIDLSLAASVNTMSSLMVNTSENSELFRQNVYF